MTRITHHATRVTHHVLRIACYVFLLTACSFPGSVRPTVKIGLVAPFEGRYRYVGYDVIYAVRLALRQANEAGGVGRSTGSAYYVELVAYDDSADRAMADEQARKLAVDPELVAAIGHFRERTTAAAADAYAEAGIPLVAPAVLNPDLTGDEKPVYRLGPTAGPVADALLDRASRLASGGEVVLVGQGGSLEKALQRKVRRRTGGGLPSVSVEGEGWDTEVLARDPSVLVCDLDPVRAGEVVSALRERGWSGQVLGGPALAASDFAAVAGRAAEGARFVTPWPFPEDVPGGEEFAAGYREVSDGVSPGPLAVPAYEATWMLLEALAWDIAAHGEPTREGMAAALPAVEREGLLGHIAFDAGHDWSDAPLYWYRIGAGGVPERVP